MQGHLTLGVQTKMEAARGHKEARYLELSGQHGRARLVVLAWALVRGVSPISLPVSVWLCRVARLLAVGQVPDSILQVAAWTNDALAQSGAL